MAFIYCLDCAERIYLGKRPWVGQSVYCDECGADLEVTSVNPLEIDWTDSLVGDEQDQPSGLEFVSA